MGKERRGNENETSAVGEKKKDQRIKRFLGGPKSAKEGKGRKRRSRNPYFRISKKRGGRDPSLLFPPRKRIHYLLRGEKRGGGGGGGSAESHHTLCKGGKGEKKGGIFFETLGEKRFLGIL